MIKNFRKSWIPPEEETSGFRPRLEPGKLKMTNPYINDSRDRDNQDLAREERKRELEEVRKSFAEKKENDQFSVENSYQVSISVCSTTPHGPHIKVYLIQRPGLDVASRQRSRSEMRSKMADDFWLKERNNKLEEDRVRIRSELENVKTTRQLFVEDFSIRWENTKYKERKRKYFLFSFINSTVVMIILF